MNGCGPGKAGVSEWMRIISGLSVRAYCRADSEIHSGSRTGGRGGFTVRVPSLPEIVTYGKDEAEALAMAEDAIRLVLQDTLARGEPLPNGEPARIREVIVTLTA